ncbi:hypothetical protein LINPERPRIM_LOCUS40295 [Linum perenne]
MMIGRRRRKKGSITTGSHTRRLGCSAQFLLLVPVRRRVPRLLLLLLMHWRRRPGSALPVSRTWRSPTLILNYYD